MNRAEWLTLLPFSMSARSQTATSLANLLNSRTWVSSSVDHLFTISSIDFPRSMDGGATVTAPPATVDPVSPVAPAPAAVVPVVVGAVVAGFTGSVTYEQVR